VKRSTIPVLMDSTGTRSWSTSGSLLATDQRNSARPASDGISRAPARTLGRKQYMLHIAVLARLHRIPPLAPPGRDSVGPGVSWFQTTFTLLCET